MICELNVKMSGIEKGNYPTHIAIILDGNRRYAKRLNLDPKKGHEFGFKKLRPLFDWCKELDIHELTLYCFSIENFNRSKDEVDYLMSEFVKKFDELNGDKTLEEDDVKINVVGRIHLFPKEVQKRLHEIIEKTKNHKTFIINFAMAYGGRSEVVDATKKIAQQVKEGTLKIENIDDEVIAKNLYFSSSCKDSLG